MVIATLVVMMVKNGYSDTFSLSGAPLVKFRFRRTQASPECFRFWPTLNDATFCGRMQNDSDSVGLFLARDRPRDRPHSHIHRHPPTISRTPIPNPTITIIAHHRHHIRATPYLIVRHTQSTDSVSPGRDRRSLFPTPTPSNEVLSGMSGMEWNGLRKRGGGGGGVRPGQDLGTGGPSFPHPPTPTLPPPPPPLMHPHPPSSYSISRVLTLLARDGTGWDGTGREGPGPKSSLKALFYRIDTDGDGGLTPNEFRDRPLK